MSSPTYDTDLTVPRRFCGPPGSGNGGYTAGLLAERVQGGTAHAVSHAPGCPAVEVTLRQPPPLDVAMRVQHVPADDPGNVTGTTATRLLMGGAKIAEAVCVDADLDTVEAVSRAEASEAMERFAGFTSHPFPTCFSCGPDRAEGDGLRIFPGRSPAAGSPPRGCRTPASRSPRTCSTTTCRRSACPRSGRRWTASAAGAAASRSAGWCSAG